MSDSTRPVEQATAAPGEKRATRFRLDGRWYVVDSVEDWPNPGDDAKVVILEPVRADG